MVPIEHVDGNIQCDLQRHMQHESHSTPFVLFVCVTSVREGLFYILYFVCMFCLHTSRSTP